MLIFQRNYFICLHFPHFIVMVFLTFSSGYFINIFLYLNIYTEQGSCGDQISSEGWEQKGGGVCAMFWNILMTQSPFWHEGKKQVKQKNHHVLFIAEVLLLNPCPTFVSPDLPSISITSLIAWRTWISFLEQDFQIYFFGGCFSSLLFFILSFPCFEF